MSEPISYRKDDKIFIITINDVKYMNSLTFDNFLEIAVGLNKANDDPEVLVTVIQSTGGFFSAGGKFESISKIEESQKLDEVPKLSNYVGGIATPNLYVTQAFIQHKKPIICCLNGPAIGLAACLVCLSDIVFSQNDSVYLLFPFTSLGFVAEVGSSVTLYEKLGVNITNQHLLFSEKIPFDILNGKIINKNYAMGNDTSKFNEQVIKDIKSKYGMLYAPSVIGMKTLINENLKQKLIKAQSMEIHSTLPFWLSGEPHKRFNQLASKQRKHKL